jgi:hypothetical protein
MLLQLRVVTTSAGPNASQLPKATEHSIRQHSRAMRKPIQEHKKSIIELT